MCLCAHKYSETRRGHPSDGGSLRAGVLGSCEPSLLTVWLLKIESKSSARARTVHAFSQWAISPAPLHGSTPRNLTLWKRSIPQNDVLGCLAYLLVWISYKYYWVCMLVQVFVCVFTLCGGKILQDRNAGQCGKKLFVLQGNSHSFLGVNIIV